MSSFVCLKGCIFIVYVFRLTVPIFISFIHILFDRTKYVSGRMQHRHLDTNHIYKYTEETKMPKQLQMYICNKQKKQYIYRQRY